MVTIMVHGDDFVAVGDGDSLKEVETTLHNKYRIKVNVVGNDVEDLNELRILNKIVRVTTEGYEIEAGPRHAELVIRELGLDDEKSCENQWNQAR